MKELTVDLCVIGAGSGGLNVASGAAQLGVRTVLIEGGDMGGECLNTGCVPSKALLHVAKTAQTVRKASDFGISTGPDIQVDYARAMAHVQDAITAIAPHDSQERFEGLGVTVIRAYGRFIDAHTVEAGDHRIRAKFFVISTGSQPLVPPITGLSETPFLTNETLFTNTQRPDHLAIMGGGAIGVEMAQAHVRLGCRVTLIERAASIMGRDDPDLVAVVRRQLIAEGVDIRERSEVTGVSGSEGALSLQLKSGTGEATLQASHLLVAVGRKPAIERLDLDAAGVNHSPRAIAVGPNMRTNQRHIFAIGDVVAGAQFTHMAAHHASVVVREMLFRLPAKAETHSVPWVTYSDPELAQIGLTETAAREAGQEPRIEITNVGGNDRYITEGVTEGIAKLVFNARGKLIGAGVVAPGAGDLITPFGLVIAGQVKLSTLASQIVPYPTHADLPKRMAGAHIAPTLFAKRTQRLINLLLKLPA